MRILIATDAWHPQVNGVVRTLRTAARAARAARRRASVLAPHEFRTVPCPTYPEIRLALCRLTARRASAFDAIQTRRDPHRDRRPDRLDGAPLLPRHGVCRSPRAIHTRFPEYLAPALRRFPTALDYALLRRFHNAGSG